MPTPLSVATTETMLQGLQRLSPLCICALYINSAPSGANAARIVSTLMAYVTHKKQIKALT